MNEVKPSEKAILIRCISPEKTHMSMQNLQLLRLVLVGVHMFHFGPIFHYQDSSSWHVTLTETVNVLDVTWVPRKRMDPIHGPMDGEARSFTPFLFWKQFV